MAALQGPLSDVRLHTSGWIGAASGTKRPVEAGGGGTAAAETSTQAASQSAAVLKLFALPLHPKQQNDQSINKIAKNTQVNILRAVFFIFK